MITLIAGVQRSDPHERASSPPSSPRSHPIVAFAVFRDSLGPAQLLGAALVIASVMTLEATGDAPERLLSAVRRVPRPSRVPCT